MSPEKPGAFGIEEVGVATNFVNRPRRAVLLIDADVGARVHVPIRTFHARAPDHVMEHITTADRGSTGTILRDVVHFPDLEGHHVTIFVEAHGYAFDLAPPIGRIGPD